MKHREPEAVIEKVLPGSIAEELGIEPGDRLVSVNGVKLRDVIDYRYQIADELLELVIKRPDGGILYGDVEKDASEDLGLEFTEELFDGIEICNNRCAFCFVHQLPKGLRRPLYIMDDDYRLSFLHNNYVTLTNLTEDDMQRILDLRLSPLYVSVHATDPDVRENLLGCPQAREILNQLKRLAVGGIEFHAQVVMCPGLNDGEVLDRTIADLAESEYGVLSLAIVPVGLSQFRQRLRPIQLVSPELAKQTIQQVHAWQKKLLQEKGTRFVFAADELYLDAGIPFPSSGAYENYPQLGDGIGMSRLFLNEVTQLRRQISKHGSAVVPGQSLYPSAALVTGVSTEPMIRKMADLLNQNSRTRFTVRPIKNKFFGESITVTGLLTGTDIRSQLAEVKNLEDIVVVPSICLRDGVFLDDLTPEDIQGAIKRQVIIVPPDVKSLVTCLFSRRQVLKDAQADLSCWLNGNPRIKTAY